ncbi:2,5-dichloro-2,5-cyclohexadiene-1,4-diol dehydrogenase [Variibacter gotjawalensis]|uniref:2,5-dichloro-2,5-cyclohexadiene-1,4-diol dehydrogenase n=1 Tax=Variibacter gotjawalensis TaxID=1333996 RepID=A0A0S3PRT5_9BRAD|nr:glucose 1-dehydrogenase [Variibacter gotjawalensis]NIK48915.1 NAD(P)-dependent dehydrogenase (short-subunit alcohol dehydrogenase family) [Variibacter gotjawalensis]RZS50771.1 NAD(P)-dependent dehydrogenase (short-subunit alcohol dehydrogenase family) [Variibacter gotjawalensis]BAT58605.1 2,5-dichloro-2,5-cyclohexadiene-1,4-diol dehydrogenase [Variibacter gotjawalensis]
MSRPNRFEGKTAFITGAANGIGRATAIAFAAEGARVAILDRDAQALSETAEMVKSAVGEVLAIPCDVSQPVAVEAAVAKTVATFGSLDYAFNNAGIENKAAPLHEIELEEWDRILNVNLRGTFICMKYELAHMVKQGRGVVVNTSSGAGIRGVEGGASYTASKHAIGGMTKSAALDYAKQNIRVNAVLPGNIATAMMDRFTAGDVQKAINLEPVGRLGQPEEIAEAVLWMCSDLGGFVTGSEIVVDGGWSL